tara:strand:+ start:3265 stop:3720 length:456 start_codon:yes stop_codon:yes gene_type:complete
MGFEINGMPVLTNAHGFVNQTNTFKTFKGQNIQGSGNITDTGSDVLEYNKVGSFTVGSFNIYYQFPYRKDNGLSNHYGWMLTNNVIPASEIKVRYYSSYGGFAYSFYNGTSANNDGDSFTYLSGTWKHKSIQYSLTNGQTGNKPALWQRVA